MAKHYTQLKPLHGKFVPDPAWLPGGYTTHSPPRALYIERSARSRSHPKYIQDPCPVCNGVGKLEGCEHCNDMGTVDGAREWRLHPVTKEPLIPMNYSENYTHERLFFVESDGQGNQIFIDWNPPTEEEIAAEARDTAVDSMIPEISGVLVDSGMSAMDIASALKQLVELGKAAQAAPDPVDIGNLAPEAAAPARDAKASESEPAAVAPVPEPVLATVSTPVAEPPHEEL